MPNDVMTSPAITEKVETLKEGLAGAAESQDNLKFARGLGELVTTLSVENARLNRVLRDETLVPPRQPLSIAAIARADAAYVIALDHLSGLWQHRIGSDYWEMLPRLPTPSEAEEEARARLEAERERARIAQSRGY